MSSVVAILKKEGLYFTIAEIIDNHGREYYNKFKNQFTMQTYNMVSKQYKIIKLFKIVNNTYILVPRFEGVKLKILSNVLNKINDEKKINIEYTGRLIKNQKIVVEHILDNVFNETNKKQGNSGCILKLSTGQGKSYCAMHIIGKLKVKTLIIVPNTYLLKQWVQLLTELFPNNTIGEYYSKKKTDGDIVVSIINSCLSKSFPFNKVNKVEQPELTVKEYYSRFDFVILDECHMYCTKTFGEVFYKIQSTYMLGLSATPDERLDGFDLMAQYHLGDIIDAELIENYSKEDVKFNSNVKIIKYDGPDELTQNIVNTKNNMINVPSMISNFIIDDKRNQLIINETIKLLNKKHNIFIFSDRRSHLELLSEMLALQISDEYTIVLYGGSSDDDIQVAQDNSKIILTTYQYSSTGVSISKLDALILATPRRNGLTQIIGRIHRLDTKYQKNKRQIIDIIDNKTVLKFQYSTRKKAYEKRDCKIKTTSIHHSDI